MSDHHRHDHHDHDLARHLERIPETMRSLEAAMARNFIPGSWLRMKFTAAEPKVLDDKGPNALALAIYNPNNFRIYVGQAGGGAAKDGFVVPKQKLVVAPLQVNGTVEFLADEEDIAAGSGFVWRVRFETPQPFFVGSL